MVDEFDETSDLAMEVEDIPTFKIGTGGIASAKQLVDQTSDIQINLD